MNLYYDTVPSSRFSGPGCTTVFGSGHLVAGDDEGAGPGFRLIRFAVPPDGEDVFCCIVASAVGVEISGLTGLPFLPEACPVRFECQLRGLPTRHGFPRAYNRRILFIVVIIAAGVKAHNHQYGA